MLKLELSHIFCKILTQTQNKALTPTINMLYNKL